MDLISGIFLTGLARVLTFGAQKYAAHNWRKGIVYSRLFASLMRHLWAWWGGEELDPESGESHLDHASCCLMFLRELSVTRKDLDDRYKNIEAEKVSEPVSGTPETQALSKGASVPPGQHDAGLQGVPPVPTMYEYLPKNVRTKISIPPTIVW